MYRGAGILPVAIKNNKYYFLLGRERLYPHYSESNQWGDFGGKKNKNEDIADTAIRECYEETMGVLGDNKKIKTLLNNNLLFKISINNYLCYVILIKYDTSCVDYFNKFYKYIYTQDKKYLKTYSNNGLFEKDKIQWISLETLLHIKDGDKIKLRRLFKLILNKLNRLL